MGFLAMTDDQIEAMRREMLSGAPFTWGSIYRRFNPPDDPGRHVDRMIQKLRRQGQIAFKREGRQCVWRADRE